jgi:hypothetical protein
LQVWILKNQSNPFLGGDNGGTAHNILIIIVKEIYSDILSYIIYLNRSQYFYEGQSTYFDELPEYLSLSLQGARRLRLQLGLLRNHGTVEDLTSVEQTEA